MRIYLSCPDDIWWIFWFATLLYLVNRRISRMSPITTVCTPLAWSVETSLVVCLCRMFAICFLNLANCFYLEEIKRLRRREPFFLRAMSRESLPCSLFWYRLLALTNRPLAIHVPTPSWATASCTSKKNPLLKHNDNKKPP